MLHSLFAEETLCLVATVFLGAGFAMEGEYLNSRGAERCGVRICPCGVENMVLGTGSWEEGKMKIRC